MYWFTGPDGWHGDCIDTGRRRTEAAGAANSKGGYEDEKVNVRQRSDRPRLI